MQLKTKRVLFICFDFLTPGKFYHIVYSKDYFLVDFLLTQIVYLLPMVKLYLYLFSSYKLNTKLKLCSQGLDWLLPGYINAIPLQRAAIKVIDLQLLK